MAQTKHAYSYIDVTRFCMAGILHYCYTLDLFSSLQKKEKHNRQKQGRRKKKYCLKRADKN